jgi:hypothetical protein
MRAQFKNGKEKFKKSVKMPHNIKKERKKVLRDREKRET